MPVSFGQPPDSEDATAKHSSETHKNKANASQVSLRSALPGLGFHAV